MLSNPRQHPPRPQFHSSLAEFLGSYVSLDNQDLREDDLNFMAQKEAALRDKIESFRKQGRLIVDSATFNEISETSGRMSLQEPRRDHDAWDAVVEAINRRSPRGQLKGRLVAGQISTRIKTYWDQRAQREDRAKVQEERRLRALAKATIKMVTNEWKKAVFVRTTYYFVGYHFDRFTQHSISGNNIDCTRRLRKGGEVTSIWMLSLIDLVLYWKLSRRNLPKVICLAADRAACLQASAIWCPTLKARKARSLKCMRKWMVMVQIGSLRYRRVTEI
jgi:hypothetical protein